MDRPFHYHDLAEDMTELMSQLEIESAVIVGYSDGGIIGLDMAIRHPARVNRLVTTGANTSVDGYTAENGEWIRTFDPTTELLSPRRMPDCRPMALSTGRSCSRA